MLHLTMQKQIVSMNMRSSKLSVTQYLNKIKTNYLETYKTGLKFKYQFFTTSKLIANASKELTKSSFTNLINQLTEDLGLSKETVYRFNRIGSNPYFIKNINQLPPSLTTLDWLDNLYRNKRTEFNKIEPYLSEKVILSELRQKLNQGSMKIVSNKKQLQKTIEDTDFKLFTIKFKKSKLNQITEKEIIKFYDDLKKIKYKSNIIYYEIEDAFFDILKTSGLARTKVKTQTVKKKSKKTFTFKVKKES